MQAVNPSATPVWLQALYSPAAVLAAVALLFRLVLVPALLRIMRTDLKPELDRLEDHHQQLPRVADRVGSVERALEDLAEVPVMLARIEEQLKTVFKERRQS